MKRALILITLVTAMAASAAAQPGPPPPRRDVLPDYLQLTDAQKAAWQSAHADFEAAVKAAHDALDAKLAATLTPEQKTKFDAFKAARELLSQHPPQPGGAGGPHPPR